MARIMIRGLDDASRERLRIRASRHSRSMEAKACEILKGALAGSVAAEGTPAEFIRRRIEPLGGVELTRLPCEPVREPPRFDE